MKTPLVAPARLTVFYGEGLAARLVRIGDAVHIAAEPDYESLLTPVVGVPAYEPPHIAAIPARWDGSMRGLPGWIADSLPDSWGRERIARHLRSKHAPLGAEDDLLTLLAFVGEDAPTALRFIPDASHEFAPPALANVAALAAEVASAKSAHAPAPLGGRHRQVLRMLDAGWSLGGAHPKIHAAFSPQGEVVTGYLAALCRAGFDPWILKLATGAHGRVEYAYHRMAVASGIRMSGCRLVVDAAGTGHFATKRFDRTATTATPFRHLAGIVGRDKIASMTCEAKWAVQKALTGSVADAPEFFRRAAFGVIAGVRDDHTRNMGFLFDGTNWQPAPAFDVTYCAGLDLGDPEAEKPRHTTSINGRHEDIARTDLFALAATLGLKPARAHDLLDEVLAVVARAPGFFADAGLASGDPYAAAILHDLAISVREMEA